jgi:threonine aldolase
MPEVSRSFASDNFAGAHPDVMAALTAANVGHSVAYGDDAISLDVYARFEDLFGTGTKTFFVFAGTGGNVTALSSLAGPGDAVVCTQWSHIHVDEAAAPERAGLKLLPFPSLDGKLRVEDLDAAANWLGSQHHPQPRIVSLTQPTEMGTLYSIDEVRTLCRRAHEHGMVVHMDGARIANATAALGGIEALRSFTVDAGVDVLTFGGTKNGLVFGEGVLYFPQSGNPRVERAVAYAPWARKQTTQLPSKARFVAAQFAAVLSGNLWVELGRRSNAAARGLFERVSDIASLGLTHPPAVNSLYPVVPEPRASELREVSFFWPWDPATQRVRWMTSWDTTEADIDAFSGAVRRLFVNN